MGKNTVSRRSRQRKQGVLGFVSVRVMADYGSSGLWLTYPVGAFRHSGISADALLLPLDLIQRFEQWIEAYYRYLEPETFDYDGFNATGRELAQALKTHLGQESYVEFVPETNEAIGTAEVIA